MLREGARTIPRYSGVHVRATGAAVSGRHGLRTRQRRLRRHTHPRTPEEKLSEATAESAQSMLEIDGVYYDSFLKLIKLQDTFIQ